MVDRLNPDIRIIHRTNKRSKYLRIIIKNQQEILVTRPALVPLREARKFLEKKENWILRKLRELEKQNRFTKENIKESIPLNPTNKQLLKNRVEYLSKKFDLHYNRCTIRKQKTRWGSCSAKNNLNLNVNLLQFPQEIIDYVILHELVHTRIKNHSKEFWQKLAEFVPNPRLKQNYLKKFNLRLL